MDSQNPNLFKQVALRTDCAESFVKDFLIYYPMNTYPVDLIHRIPEIMLPVMLTERLFSHHSMDSNPWIARIQTCSNRLPRGQTVQHPFQRIFLVYYPMMNS